MNQIESVSCPVDPIDKILFKLDMLSESLKETARQAEQVFLIGLRDSLDRMLSTLEAEVKHGR